MYEKQALLESTKAGITDLLRRKGSVAGADRLHDELQDVVSRWRALQDACKNRIALMEGLKDFYDTHDNLSSWLASKDRMITVLGPISSDSRMVQSQTLPRSTANCGLFRIAGMICLRVWMHDWPVLVLPPTPPENSMLPSPDSETHCRLFQTSWMMCQLTENLKNSSGKYR
ncbi:hypothetical protein LSTR_LSTR015817 [Laodelphax striatellus]|uniref:Uncharacterized protein n=1 Tax=Laodelphax striatellus TaxID=195883 RepID=A0A482XK49_LAOST|nr:hypothetical protein LSTR_LSTR015817 [Laodelphax striatellus]